MVGRIIAKIKRKIQNIRVDSLTMNQESLAECLVPGRWWNPFPKFKYTERPDTAAAQVLEGNVILLVDNPSSRRISAGIDQHRLPVAVDQQRKYS